MSRPVVALLTDFGTRDGYVAAMKGVILGIRPDTPVVDITHDVPPQGVRQAAYVLQSVYCYFPDGTIFIVVVDPGVGTRRRPLALETTAMRFVGPDNGVFSYILRDALPGRFPHDPAFAPTQVQLPGGWRAVSLTNQAYWRHPTSTTFHGRDIFAPAAAHLASGVTLDELGEGVETVTALAVPEPSERNGIIQGTVLHIDHFGDLVTNIPAEMVQGRAMRVILGHAIIDGLSYTYGDGRGLIALVGSHGNLEIAEAGGSAEARAGATVGDDVWIEIA